MIMLVYFLLHDANDPDLDSVDRDLQGEQVESAGTRNSVRCVCTSHTRGL